MKKAAVISIHVFAWLVILILPVLSVVSSGKEIPEQVKIYLTITYAFHPVIFYYFFIFVVPRHLAKGSITYVNILVYILAGILLFLVKSAMVYLIDHLFNLRMADYMIYSATYFLNDLGNTFIFILAAVLTRIAMKWFRDKKEKTELALEENKLELDLLKAQVNPHFFFNTLNNIYSLVYKKSDDAPHAVMKLSEIMRYMIYDSKSDMVPLEKEVEQLENFIELERLRAKDPGFIEFLVRGDLMGNKIPPMLLLSFVENAFKHGSKKVTNPGIIITVGVENNKIIYEVVNHVITEPHNNHSGEGIGMKNTRRRLELLYPGCYTLDIKKSADLYVVKLTLDCRD